MDRLEALRLLGYELLEHISAEMIDFFGAREPGGKVVLLGTIDQKRSKSKASWDMYLGHFLLKAKRERERVLLCSPGRKSGTQDRCVM